MNYSLKAACLAAALCPFCPVAFAQQPPPAAPAPSSACPVNESALATALKAAVKPGGGPGNGGLDNNEWGAVVNRDGVVCAIVRTGNPGDQWPGSRAIAIEKANTANALSLPHFALSTANIYAGAQPGGMLYGLITTNPPATADLGAGTPAQWGTDQDPMLHRPASGIVVFGGGLALYSGKTIVGALGVSGDTSCADHNIAWRVRHALKLDRVPGGVSAKNNDAIVYDIAANGKSRSGYGHPTCAHNEQAVARQIGASAAGK
jgi:uncharacterized protein GlcG (DUF336 family)